MRRLKKTLSVVLVMAMVVSLFAGIRLFDFSNATQAKAGINFQVLELVPDSSESKLQQFNLIKDSFMTAYNNQIDGAISSVSVTTVQPNELSDALIASADLIVINQTGTGGKITGKTFNDVTLDWEWAYKIFKKIAGVGCDPTPFVIDKSIGTDISKSNKTWYAFYTARYDDQCNDADFIDPAADGIMGTNNAAFKLFLMLEELNPATFYGLYIAQNGYYWGIDETDGSIIGVGFDNKKSDGRPLNGTVFDPSYKNAIWSEAALYPYFLDNSNVKIQGYGSKDGNSTLSSQVDWIFDFKNDTAVSGSSVNRNNGTLVCMTDDGFGKTIADAGASSADLTNIVNTAVSYKRTSNPVTNDVKNYRFLIVSPLTLSSTANRSIIASIIGSDRSHRYLGGITVDCLSMSNFINVSEPLSDKYDCIYFTGDGSKYCILGDELSLVRAKYWEGDTDYNTYAKWVLDKNSYTSGIDLTEAKRDELLNFDGIILNDTTNPTDGTLAASFLSGYSTGFDASTIIGSINTANPIGLQLISTPNLYTSRTNFDFLDENGGYSYQSDDVTIGNYSNYINDSAHPNRYSLDFKFTAKATGTYTVKIYVDYNSDGVFNTTPGGYDSNKQRVGGELVKSTSVTLPTTDGDMVASVSANPVPSGYVGPVTWKFEIEKDGHTASEIGFSACRRTSDKGIQTVHLLQIVPVDDKGQWGASTQRYNISMLLPTKEEIFNANWGHKNISGTFSLGNIQSYSTKKGDGELDSIKKYFSGYISTDIVGSATPDPITWDDSIRSSQILSNIGLYYYFMDKQKDYDITVTRMSVDEFNTKVGSDPAQITKNDSTKRIMYPEKIGFENVTMYNYIHTGINNLTAEQKTAIANEIRTDIPASVGKDVNLDLIFTSEGWNVKATYTNDSGSTESKEGWTYADFLKERLNGYTGSTWEKEIKATDDEGYIIRLSIDSANNVTVSKNKAPVETTQTISCDLLMFGFCIDMQDIDHNGVILIRDHIANGNPVFIGKGAVSPLGDNELAQEIRGLVGMDRFNVAVNAGDSKSSRPASETYSLESYKSGDKYLFQGLTKYYSLTIDNTMSSAMETNKTVLSNYPYKIPDKFKCTAGNPNFYQLNLDYDTSKAERTVVAFAKHLNGSTNWGDTRNTYYVYKKDNVTFSCIGHNSDKVDGSQRGGIFTLPESALLVNALIAGSQRQIKGNSQNGFVECTDPDSSSTVVNGTSGTGKTYKDFVYVDYDGTKTGMTGSSSAPIDNPYIVEKDGILCRKIPYEATVATTAEIAIYKSYDKTSKSGQILPITIEKVKDDGTTEAMTNNGTDYHYNITNGTTYYLYVPIQDSGFEKLVTDAGMNASVADGLGLTARDDFKLDLVVTTDGDNTKQEYNELTIVRRGMFIIN
ncbi:MAG: DUF5057 domain-containing protein [Lachnospiraceae bacterium]|nr:DUF5057 domain-containing protein [Lachnospiraceae bacterium]